MEEESTSIDIAEARYDAAIDALTDTTWPVVASERSSTGRPIDDIINNPRFMISAIYGTPCTPRSPEQRAKDSIRRDMFLARMSRGIDIQRKRISYNQSRGEESYYNGSAANDNTPMQRAAA